MRKIFVLLLCVFVSVTLCAQNPGFMGKRLVFHYNFNTTFDLHSMGFHTEMGAKFPFIMKAHEFNIECAVGQYTTLLLLGSVENMNMFVSNYDWDYDWNNPSFYPKDEEQLTPMQVYSFGFGFRNINELAPWGRFFEMNIRYASISMLNKLGPYYRPMHLGSEYELNTSCIMLGVGFGNNVVLGKHFMLTYGLYSNWSLTVIGDMLDGTTIGFDYELSDENIIQRAEERYFGASLVRCKIGLGFML